MVQQRPDVGGGVGENRIVILDAERHCLAGDFQPQHPGSCSPKTTLVPAPVNFWRYFVDSSTKSFNFWRVSGTPLSRSRSSATASRRLPSEDRFSTRAHPLLSMFRKFRYEVVNFWRVSGTPLSRSRFSTTASRQLPSEDRFSIRSRQLLAKFRGLRFEIVQLFACMPCDLCPLRRHCLTRDFQPQHPGGCSARTALGLGVRGPGFLALLYP